MGKVFSKYLDPVTMEKPDLVTVTTDTSAMDCLKLIREHKFLCLPVMNPHHEDRIVGLIDVMDLTAYVVTLYDRTKGTEKEVGSYFNFNNVFQRFLEGRRASDLMNYSGTNFCYPKDESTTLRELLTALAGPSARVPIVAKSSKLDITGKKKRKLVRFVTRSDIMQFACNNLDFFGPRLEHTLQEEGFGRKPVHTAQTTQITIDAFREMVAKHLSALAVVDEKGCLVGNLSARDVRLLIEHPQETIQLPLGEFLEKVKNVHAHYVYCTAGETMRHAITKMKGAGTHRLWIVNESMQPVSVLSMSDVCKYIATLHIPDTKLQQQPEPIPPTKKDFYATKADIKHLEGVVAAALVGSVDQPSENASKESDSTCELRDWTPSVPKKNQINTDHDENAGAETKHEAHVSGEEKAYVAMKPAGSGSNEKDQEPGELKVRTSADTATTAV